MRIVCAWCKAVIKPAPDTPHVHGSPYPITLHGICPDCYRKQEAILDHMGPDDHATVTDADVGGES